MSNKYLRQLKTIQTEHNLNRVYAVDRAGPGNVNHVYAIAKNREGREFNDVIASICFQNGPRNDSNSIDGVLDTDLLEIVRDRLKAFQSSEFTCEYNACALRHIEEALYQMKLRVQDRAERKVLGTNET